MLRERDIFPFYSMPHVIQVCKYWRIKAHLYVLESNPGTPNSLIRTMLDGEQINHRSTIGEASVNSHAEISVPFGLRRSTLLNRHTECAPSALLIPSRFLSRLGIATSASFQNPFQLDVVHF